MADQTPTHYFSSDPGVASRPNSVALHLPDLYVDLTTDTGVFSGSKIDAGTKLLLLEAVKPCADEHMILDLGCGYGPIAVTAGRRAPHAKVWAVDVNERAVSLCAANAVSAGATNVTAVSVDDIPPDLSFDLIVSNPPIRIGKAALHKLLITWLSKLNPGGRAELVVQKHLGSDSLQAWLTSNGWPTTRTVSRGGYRILDVRRSGSPGPSEETT